MNAPRVLLTLIALFLLVGCQKDSPSTPDVADGKTTCLYQLPFLAEGKYTTTQGMLSEFPGWSHVQGRPEQYALDFGLPNHSEVLAARGGVVSKVRDGNTICGGQDKEGYSNFVIVDHGDGTFAFYNHLEAGIPVIEGENISQGQFLGYSGNSGYSNCGPDENGVYHGYHLHFQLQERGDAFGESIPLTCFENVEGGGIPQRGMVLAPAEKIPSISAYVSGVEVVETPETEPHATPVRPEELVKADLYSVLRWAVYAVLTKDAQMLAELVGPDGADFYPNAVGFEFKGYNNSSDIAHAFEQILAASSPACLGYRVYPDDPKIELLFDGVLLGVATDRVDEEATAAKFIFLARSGELEMVVIGSIPEYALADETHGLTSCEDLTQ